VHYKGKVYEAGQGNNMYIFPGLGFGSFLAKATEVSDGMIIAAAKALADFVTKEELDAGKIYPRLEKIREISTSIAVAVIERAISEVICNSTVTRFYWRFHVDTVEADDHSYRSVGNLQVVSKASQLNTVCA
jgi:malic enzyme